VCTLPSSVPQCRCGGDLFLEIGATQPRGRELGPLLAAAAILALAIGAWRLRPQSAAWVLLFLWVPLLFYALSIAYGSVLVMSPRGGRLPYSTSVTDSSCCRCSRFRPEC